uniref:Uncharacterized protein n=1 Tax=Aureoumbra lagunensis TaxID=44058 RepID=A0A7S3NQW0_9STRA
MVITRLLLCIMEVCVYAIARVELVAPRQSYIALNATIYGMIELWLSACKQYPRFLPSHWIMITYGVAWFVVPKMSALQFLPACCGSAIIVTHWFMLSVCTTNWGSNKLNHFFDFWFGSMLRSQNGSSARRDSYQIARFLCRSSVQGTQNCTDNIQQALLLAAKHNHPSTTHFNTPSWTQTIFLSSTSSKSPALGATTWLDITAGLALAVPVIVLFNVVAYSSEKSVKERFVLRSALSHEHNHDVRLALLSSGNKTIFALVKDAIAQAEAKYARVFSIRGDNSLGARRKHRKRNHQLINREESDSDSDASSVASSVLPNTRKTHNTSMKKRHRAMLAFGPCALLAALGWFPRAQRMTSQLVMDSLGGADAAWAALTHVAGLTLFLLVVTRRVRFVFLTPLVCVGLLWLLAQVWQQPQNMSSLEAANWWILKDDPNINQPPDQVTDFCAAACGAFGNKVFALDTVACRACFDAIASQKDSILHQENELTSAVNISPSEASLASALRLVGSLVLTASFIYALGLFAKMIRLFARLVQFSRRTLFLYPHLAKELVGHECSRGDEETLKKLVSSDRLPKVPGGPAAVRDALLVSHDTGKKHSFENKHPSDSSSSDDEDTFCMLAAQNQSYRNNFTSQYEQSRLPILAIGAHESACSFCSRDAHSRVRRATHVVPVCSAWAQWYLARASNNDLARRLASELGESLEDTSSAAQQHRPCCDFSTLALDRAELVSENRSLKARIAELEKRLYGDISNNPSCASCSTSTFAAKGSSPQ